MILRKLETRIGWRNYNIKKILYNIYYMDSYYANCPARSYSRDLTNYKSNSMVNEYIKYENGITRDDDYRLFLQTNADKIMDSEWLYLRQNYSCFNNACVHDYPLRMNPKLFVQERERADSLFKKKFLSNDLKCQQFADYRMTKTPLSNYSIDTGCGKKCNK